MQNIPDQRIIDFINEHHVLTLATCSDNQPYCANCFYTYLNDDNTFVFNSDDHTKHIQDIKGNSKVGASIVLETKTIGKIQGLQITGKLEEAFNENLTKAKKAYLKAFPFAILTHTKLWLLKVEFFKMTDNRLGFGKKILWEKK
ncbi:MAG: pyridoxamine 5'-phosphate oxidase family protein [Bacteroidales bacterium]|nr:pyridoxamine 5'-phosphate oxidase family protein [Bacteroidales bacterium]